MKAQLSRERLEALANIQSLECMALPASHAESAEMARMLLAGMDNEPVAYFYPGDETEWQGVALTEELDDEQKARCIPLYAAPPAPVAVPDKITSANAPEVFEIAAEAERLGLRGAYASYAVGWNACRAAMLNAGPVTAATVTDGLASSVKCWCRTCRPVTITDMRFVVCPDCGNKRCPRANDHRNACSGSNEPGQVGSAYQAEPDKQNAQQNIPGGWIKCSERMPAENDRDIWLWNGSGHPQNGYIWNGDRFVDWNEEYMELDDVTHWMPMSVPAAPEQEV